MRTGLPLMRPLAFDDPGDARAWDHPLQYRLGPDLVVAPVTEPGATSWDVYLPEGEWADVWTGEVPRGSPTVETPIERIPVFVRLAAASSIREARGPAEP